MMARFLLCRFLLCRFLLGRAGLLCLLLAIAAAPAHAGTRPDPRTLALLGFIGALEAPAGYDSYSGYAAAPPPRPLTHLSVAEVLDWQDSIDAASRSEAAGRYQIMEDTLRDYLVPTLGLTGRERFTPAFQDRLGAALLARRGWDPNRRYSETGLIRLGNALAREWAALPRLSGPGAGRSAYHQTPGVRNRALTSPATFLAALRDPGTAPRIGLSRAARAKDARPLAHRRITRTRPPSPATLTGGALTPSRVLVYTTDPYAQD